jgi:hypothetical protein
MPERRLDKAEKKQACVSPYEQVILLAMLPV